MNVTSCTLQSQAATTGEAVMEEALASLAQRDPSRFQRLNQRMQVRTWVVFRAPIFSVHRSIPPCPS